MVIDLLLERGKEVSKLIVVEGTDCSGKETQSRLLVEKLNSMGKKSVYITFPNYNSPTGKIVGGPYLGKEEICKSFFKEGAVHVDPKIASLYFAADRYYNLSTIQKYLDDGYIIIMDRYVTSNMAHQGGKITSKEERKKIYDFIDQLEYGLLHLPKPDKTIFLHMPYEYALELKKNRLSLDEHEKSKEHLKNAEKAYLELKDIYNFTYVNCVSDNKIRTIEDINNEILRFIP